MSSLPEALLPWLPLNKLLVQLVAGEVPDRTSVHHDPLTGVYRVLFYQHKLFKRLKYMSQSVVLHDPALRMARAIFDGQGRLLQLELHPFAPGQAQEVWLGATQESANDVKPLPGDGARPGPRADRKHHAAGCPTPAGE